MGRNLIMGIAGLTLFFLVLTVLYTLFVIGGEPDEILLSFAPFVFLSGLFIFIIGAILLGTSIYRTIAGKN